MIKDSYFVNTTGSSNDDISDGGVANGAGSSTRHADKNHHFLYYILASILNHMPARAAMKLYADEDIDVNSPKQQVQVEKVYAHALSEVRHDALSIITIDDAKQLTNREGVPYTEIEPERLAHMSRSIDKVIKSNGHDPDRLQILKTKQAAIKVILNEHAAGSIQEP